MQDLRLAIRALGSTPVVTGVAILSLALKDLQDQSRQDGDLKTLELLARSEDKDERTYRYRMIMSNNTYLVRLTLEKDGKVSGLWAEEE